MKKLFLLIISGCLALGANAQDSYKSVVFKEDGPKLRPANNDYRFFTKEANAAAAANGARKTTAGGAKWYSTYDVADAYLGNILGNNDFVFYIDWDSTLTQKYTTGQGGVNWLAVASFIDPIMSQGHNDATLNPTTDIKVEFWNSYTVDSVFIPAAYIQSPTGLTTTRDTLYISAAAVAYNDASLTTTDYPAVTSYDQVSANGNVLKVQRLGFTDSFNRQLGNAGAVKWKVALIDTLRKPKNTDGTYPVRNLKFALPTPLTVPAGSGFAISVAFKPGEPWANGDSVQKHHYFMPLAASGAANTIMPYFYYKYKDHSMSYLMHYQFDGGFSSSISLELANTNAFDKEFINMAAHVSCATCATIGTAAGIDKITNVVSSSAYPSPASSDLNITFSLKDAVNAKVSLTNAIGQVISTQDMGTVSVATAKFDVSNLANGVYFYTINADGQNTTSRFVVNR